MLTLWPQPECYTSFFKGWVRASLSGSLYYPYTRSFGDLSTRVQWYLFNERCARSCWPLFKGWGKIWSFTLIFKNKAQKNVAIVHGIFYSLLRVDIKSKCSKLCWVGCGEAPMRMKREGVSWESLVIKVPEGSDCLLAVLCEWDPLGWSKNRVCKLLDHTHASNPSGTFFKPSFEVTKKVNHMNMYNLEVICSHYGATLFVIVWVWRVWPKASWVEGLVSN